MMKPIAVELKAHIKSHIWNYEELPHLITSLQDSHAWVFRSMDIFVHAHGIMPIGTLTEAKTKTQVPLELDSYFDEFTGKATSASLEISVATMHQYVFGLNALKTMVHMLSDELDRGAK